MEDDDPYSELDMEERAYVGLHDAMMKMYQNEDRQAFRIAAQLLTKANLPALIQARCHMLLSTKRDTSAVSHAETAVELLDRDVRALVPPAEFPIKQLELAQRMLQRAKEREEAGFSASGPSGTSTTSAGPSISKADRLALEEAAIFLGANAGEPAQKQASGSTKEHGLSTPGESVGTSLHQSGVQHGTIPADNVQPQSRPDGSN